MSTFEERMNVEVVTSCWKFYLLISNSYLLPYDSHHKWFERHDDYVLQIRDDREFIG